MKENSEFSDTASIQRFYNLSPDLLGFKVFENDAAAQTIVTRFEEMVRRYPDHTAVKVGNQAVTYWLLNQMANRVSHELLTRRGHGSEPIALLFDADVFIFANILAVLKAGKFYVPLDPSHPKARTFAILKDAQAGMLLTDRRNYSLAWETAPRSNPILLVDEMDPQGPSENPGLDISPDQLSSVMYTSGSTGQPKGVMQNHRNVLHKVMDYTHSVHVSSEDRFALIYSPSAGGSVRDIFCSLLNGAALYPFDIKKQGLVHLGHWLADEHITMYNSVATLFRHFAASLPPKENFPGLRVIRLGSEAIYKRDIELYKERFSDNCVLVTHLGATEISPIRQFIITKDTPIPSSTVPAGYPVPDTHVFLLDKNGNEVAPGQVGEIVVSSPYLSPGYWRKKEITDAVFLPNPHKKNERMYKTGDLGRMLPDGCLTHMGRKDFQVKIRGNRVETAEIETALFDIGGIKEAVVHAYEDHPGEQRLAAYIVLEDPADASPDHFRNRLSSKLPDYMIPSVFVFLDELPKTATRKVDRRSLPAPDRMCSQSKTPFVAPRTPAEKEIADIWSEVLNLNPVGIYDNFLDCGGNSLTAILAVSRIFSKFSVDLPLQTFFKFSTVAELAAHIEETRSKSRQQPRTIPKISKKAPLPLSFAQERLWLHHQLNPDSPNNVCRAFRIQGPLRFEALRNALITIVNRHEALRTTYKRIDGNPTQVIHPEHRVDIIQVDLSNCPVSDRKREVQRLISVEARHLFDLSTDSLLRTVLINLGDSEHLLILTIHHIATDGFSMGLLFRELSVIYGAPSDESPLPPLPDLPVQYADYALWQKTWMENEVLEKQLNYWKTQLADLPSVLHLPTDVERPSVRRLHGAEYTLILNEELVDLLKELSKQKGVTIFTTMMAAFKALLYRYTGQGDICVGTFAANRNRVEIENLIGFFVNTLVLRTHLAGELSFTELLGREHQVALNAFSHQDIPFEKILEVLNPKRDSRYTPVFQVALAYQNLPKVHTKFRNLQYEPLQKNSAISLYDLSLIVEELTEGSLKLSFKYRTDIFKYKTIERWAINFKTLLESIVKHPEQPIAKLPLLNASETQQVMMEWNETAVEYPEDVCIHEMFEAQVKRTPDAVAVVFDTQQMTYRELDSRANRLARYLRKRGVGPETLVGICIERSLEMIIGVLGILKAGGAYVPIDPNYPADRLKFMLEDAKLSVLLVQERFCSVLPVESSERIRIDTDWHDISRESDKKPNESAKSHNAAYVIYTSGSTGQPKGVIVEHKSLVNFTQAVLSRYGIVSSDRILQFATFSFDASAEEIYPCLACGATLVLRTGDMLNSISEFLKRCADWRISVTSLPTAFWHELTNSLETENIDLPDTLRLVIIGGEKASLERFHQWRRRVASQVTLLNTYGPTEATVVATMCNLNRLSDEDRPIENIPIGSPLPNIQIFILDPHLQPVPIGVCGELYIGGDCLARGYLNRPEIETQRFIAHPFQGESGARLYRTGDLARYNDTGVIEFLGRHDCQVKFRGYRIEPEEIASVLRKHPDIHEAIVICTPGRNGDQHLAAYTVTRQQTVPSSNELRTFVKKYLPEYMIPTIFMSIGTIPLTPNGKIDRGALPPLITEPVSLNDKPAPATSEIERKLVDIWERVLGVQPIGINDDFFDLGGHSLLAVRLISEIKNATGTEVSIAELFQKPTIELLARNLKRPKASPRLSLLIPHNPEGSKPPFFCIHGASAYLASHLGADQPFYGAIPHGLNGKRIPLRMEEIADDYLREIRRVQPKGPYYLGGYSLGGLVVFELAQQLKAQGETVNLLFLIDPKTPSGNKKKSNKEKIKLPFASSFPIEGNMLKSHVNHIKKHLKSIDSRERIIYLLSRVWQRLFKHTGIERKTKIALSKAILARGWDLPRFLRPCYFDFGARRAIRLYRPKYYSGDAVIISSLGKTAKRKAYWSLRIKGKLDCYEIPVEHLSMLNEPNARKQAEILKNYLQILHT